MATQLNLLKEPVAGSSSLPTTIEGATERYLNAYKKFFKGEASERDRLAGEFISKITKLRKKAPRFYEQKLPKLIIQAGSALLACEISKAHGINAFHVNHKNLLLILDELCKSQPAGEVDFQKEKDRVKQREILVQQQLKLRKRLNELEASEFGLNEVGVDADDTSYYKIFDELGRVRRELKAVSTKLAAMEAESIEEKITFDLKLPASTILKKLSDEQLQQFQREVINFLEPHKGKRLLNLIDKSCVDAILMKIGISSAKNKEEFIDYSRDAFDVVRRHFRDIEAKRMNERYDILLKNSSLRPKEGLILDDPDNIPEEVKEKLAMSERLFNRELAIREERLRNAPIPEDDIDDNIEECNDDANDEDDADIRTFITQHDIFNRVKEEPRDDYDNDAPSDDELFLEPRPSTSNGSTGGYNGGPSKRFKGPEGDDDDDDDCIIISDDEEEEEETNGDAIEKANGNSSNELAQNGTGSTCNGNVENANEEEEEDEEEDEVVPTFTDAQSKLDQIFCQLEDSDSESENVAYNDPGGSNEPEGSEDPDETSDKEESGHQVVEEPREQMPTELRKPADEEIELLGTIAPADKIAYIELD